jgi:hypothetical protein
MERMRMEKRATVTAAAEGVTITATADLDLDRIVGPVLVQLPAGSFTVGPTSIGLPAELIERLGSMVGEMRRRKVGDTSDLCTWHGYFDGKASRYDCPRCAEEAAEEKDIAAATTPISTIGDDIAAIALGHVKLIRSLEPRPVAAPALESVG